MLPSVLPISVARQDAGMTGDHQILIGFYHIGGDAARWCADADLMLARFAASSSSSPSQPQARQMALRTGAAPCTTRCPTGASCRPPSRCRAHGITAGNISLGVVAGAEIRGCDRPALRPGCARRGTRSKTLYLAGEKPFFALVKTEFERGGAGVDHADQWFVRLHCAPAFRGRASTVCVAAFDLDHRSSKGPGNPASGFRLSGASEIGENGIQIFGGNTPSKRTQAMKRLTIISLSALLTLSATPDAFAWGAVSGARGGAAYRGPMGGAAVRTPSGAAAVRTPSGAAAARGPYGGTAVRGPVNGGGTVYRGATVTPGVGYGVAAGAAVGVAAGAAAGAAAASTYSSSCYYPPYYCYPPAYYQPPAW